MHSLRNELGPMIGPDVFRYTPGVGWRMVNDIGG